MTARAFPLAGVTQRRGRGRRAALRDDAARALRRHRGRRSRARLRRRRRIRSTASSRPGDDVWFADGPELGVVDGERVAETTGVHVAPDATLAPSPSGDVWVLGSGALLRFARPIPESALEPRLVDDAGAHLRPLLLVVPPAGRRVRDGSVDRRGVAVGAQRDSGPRRREQDDAPRGPRPAGGRPRRYRRLGATSPANRAMRGETNRKVTLPRRRTARRPFPRLLPVRLLPVRPLRGLPPPRRRFRRDSARSARTARRR